MSTSSPVLVDIAYDRVEGIPPRTGRKGSDVACELQPDVADVVGGPLDGGTLPLTQTVLAADGSAAVDPFAGFDDLYHLSIDDEAESTVYVWGAIARGIVNRDHL